MSCQLIIQLKVQIAVDVAASYCSAGVWRWVLWRSWEGKTCTKQCLWSWPLVELHANPCSLPADVFAWGNVLACARMTAKMRRQWQRPILFYFMFFCLLLDPGALRNFACVVLRVNFLCGCLSLRWWEKGWGLCAVHLEEASDGHRAVEWRIRQRACS